MKTLRKFWHQICDIFAPENSEAVKLKAWQTGFIVAITTRTFPNYYTDSELAGIISDPLVMEGYDYGLTAPCSIPMDSWRVK